jgi:hypothetical protein
MVEQWHGENLRIESKSSQLNKFGEAGVKDGACAAAATFEIFSSRALSGVRNL